jgi:orotate phosphoribosyltransferase
MENYKKQLANTLAETGALFFNNGLILKDGRPTPYFVNFGMFRTGRLSMLLGTYFADMLIDRGLINDIDIILGPSYKGSAIALATAIALYDHHGHDILFEYDRKEAKVHGEGSTSGSIMVNRTLFDGCRIFIVDDVATSMATKYELLDRLNREAENKKISLQVKGIGIAIDREQTTAVYDEEGEVVLDKKGEDAISTFVETTDIPVYSVAGIREVIEYLYKEKMPLLINDVRRPLDEQTKKALDDYLNTYGSSLISG